MAKRGSVYCIANDTMPGIVKIGATLRNPEDRLNEARASTWAPSCFRIIAQAAVEDAFGTESLLASKHFMRCLRIADSRRGASSLRSPTQRHARSSLQWSSSPIVPKAPIRAPRGQWPPRIPALARHAKPPQVAHPVMRPHGMEGISSVRGWSRATPTFRWAGRTAAASWRSFTARMCTREFTRSRSARRRSGRCSVGCTPESDRTRARRAP